MLFSVACKDQTQIDKIRKNTADLIFQSKDMAKAQSLAAEYCGTCHIKPEPSELNSEAWREVLSAMAPFLGFPREIEGQSLWEYPNIVKPARPVISQEDWALMKSYYLGHAWSEEASAPRKRPPVCDGIFQPVIIDHPAAHAVITFVQIDDECNCLRFADASTGKLYQVDNKGVINYSWNLNAAVTGLVKANGRLYGIAAKNLLPNDEPSGLFFELHQDKVRVLADDLMRPVNISVMNNRDVIPEFLIAEFGNFKGRLSVMLSNGKRVAVSDERPGFIASVSASNQTYVLSAQARERLSLIQKSGKQLVEKPYLEFSPAFGVTSIDVFSRDNSDSLAMIISNGDNGDLQSMPLKPYHGVRIYQIKKNSSSPRYFYPLYGAYKTVAEDFNLDGKQDIAVISYFFDKKNPQPEKATLLLNDGSNDEYKFAPCSLPSSHKGRFITMDAGDINKDGKPDLVLGAAYTPQFDLGNLDGLQSSGNRIAVLLLINNTQAP